MKRSRLTIDVSPEMLQLIKIAAIKSNLSISEYVLRILQQVVPDEANMPEPKLHPVPPDILEEVYRVREQVIRESKGHIFEDSAEVLRRLREERTQYLEQMREQ